MNFGCLVMNLAGCFHGNGIVFGYHTPMQEGTVTASIGNYIMTSLLSPLHGTKSIGVICCQSSQL